MRGSVDIIVWNNIFAAGREMGCIATRPCSSAAPRLEVRFAIQHLHLALRSQEESTDITFPPALVAKCVQACCQHYASTHPQERSQMTAEGAARLRTVTRTGGNNGEILSSLYRLVLREVRRTYYGNTFCDSDHFSYVLLTCLSMPKVSSHCPWSVSSSLSSPSFSQPLSPPAPLFHLTHTLTPHLLATSTKPQTPIMNGTSCPTLVHKLLSPLTLFHRNVSSSWRMTTTWMVRSSTA